MEMGVRKKWNNSQDSNNLWTSAWSMEFYGAARVCALCFDSEIRERHCVLRQGLFPRNEARLLKEALKSS